MARVLLLEDEKVIREVLAEYIKMAGYEVDEADNGNAALNLLAAKEYDIAVLDIMVPGVNGIEVLRRIRAGGFNPGMGVLMLTAIDDIPSQVEAFNAYADDYIIKPVSPIILLKRIETVLRRTASEQASVLERRGLRLDKTGFRLSFRGENIPFTLSEFLILQQLMENEGRVLSREQLIMGAFNEDYMGGDRIIDAHIKNIRKKLPMNCIKTIIGIGYSFSVEAGE